MYKTPNESGFVAEFSGTYKEAVMMNCRILAELHEKEYNVPLFCSEEKLK